MATYKEIKGITVQTLDSDPVVNAGSWSSGGDVNTARNQGGGAGTQTAASLFGGYSSPKAYHEYYNGTSWSEQTDLNTGRASAASGGTQTASLLAGGYTTTNVTNTEIWNGSSWTETTEINTSRRGLSSLGQVNTAILAAGGYTTTAVNNVENWNGSSWTEIAEVTTTGYSGSGSGTNTEGLILNLHPSSTNQYWNGSSWTELADTNVPHSPGSGASQQGSYTAALIFGGADPSLAKTESWDGSSWTEVADLATARRGIRGAGTSTVALAMSGEVPPVSAATEEFSFPPPTAAVLNEGDLFLSGGTTLKGFGKNAGIPAATWSSGGNMNTGRSNHFALGGLNDNLVTSPQGVVTTEQYNGTSWTALSSPANSGEGRAEGGSAGTSAAGVIFGGWEPGASALTELWNGSSWAETADLNTGRNELAGFGTSTAAFGAGGPSPSKTLVESWDGTSWTETTEINTGRGNMGGSGTTTDGLIFGGNQPNNANAEKWDGSAWTEVGDLNTARRYGAAGGGVGPISIYAGGYTGSSSAVVESWNGSSWTEINDLSSADYSTKGAPAGTNISTIVTGGGESNTTTEEFTADLALAAVTVS